eukprot:CAMPEP_0196587960 /NCGR_PEP_ID=MMETSP1081-20130531/59167_1 /TAXON_ID=36882 /ORGANISM="Pyramimonas amylifera, Strain CCMP720" /LENGTH=230 /DNA_ID=CAMNT_0041910311 /DNA_START=649 /DNA_END=1342 /DNA_ORIENTATION=-
MWLPMSSSSNSIHLVTHVDLPPTRSNANVPLSQRPRVSGQCLPAVPQLQPLLSSANISAGYKPSSPKVIPGNARGKGRRGSGMLRGGAKGAEVFMTGLQGIERVGRAGIEGMAGRREIVLQRPVEVMEERCQHGGGGALALLRASMEEDVERPLLQAPHGELDYYHAVSTPQFLFIAVFVSVHLLRIHIAIGIFNMHLGYKWGDTHTIHLNIAFSSPSPFSPLPPSASDD